MKTTTFIPENFIEINFIGKIQRYLNMEHMSRITPQTDGTFLIEYIDGNSIQERLSDLNIIKIARYHKEKFGSDIMAWLHEKEITERPKLDSEKMQKHIEAVIEKISASFVDDFWVDYASYHLKYNTFDKEVAKPVIEKTIEHMKVAGQQPIFDFWMKSLAFIKAEAMKCRIEDALNKSNK